MPALADEYTQGLSLWKHRVIRQAVLEEQDQVDLVALGKAKRKIQQIVDADRQRKRQSTRSRIARWDTAGKPSRQAIAELDAGDMASVTNTEKPMSIGTNQPASVSPALLSADEGNWEISYAPLRHDNEKQVQNG